MDFSKGYTASFYGTYLDPHTFSDAGRFEIVSGSINNQEGDLRQSANLSLNGYNDVNDQWIRVYMNASQGSDNIRVPLFTGLASSPSTAFNNGVRTTNVQCYSVLKAISDILLPIGWYAPIFSNSGEQLRKLLESVPFGVDISDDTPYLEYPIVAEENETNLSMVNAILSTMVSSDGHGYKLQINGDGSISISPYSEDPVSIFSVSINNVVETSFDTTRDWFNCPNVFRVSYGDYTAIARDDDEDSELSTISRGREIWMAENSVDLMDNESIGEYAKRRLGEEQLRSEKISYSRRYMPDINVGDMIRIHYPDIQGDFYIESQSITLGPAAKTQETIYREI